MSKPNKMRPHAFNERVLSGDSSFTGHNTPNSPFEVKFTDRGDILLVVTFEIPVVASMIKGRLHPAIVDELRRLEEGGSCKEVKVAARLLIRYYDSGSLREAVRGSQYSCRQLWKIGKQVHQYGPGYIEWRFSKANPSKSARIPSALKAKWQASVGKLKADYEARQQG